ncbi:MAG: beta-lactamase family protein [Synergistaceae bacterium]|nr:beta-lactamase family protein [Synergistaceae bacterium]
MRTRYIYALAAMLLLLCGCNGGSSSSAVKDISASDKQFLDNALSGMIGERDEQVPGLGVIVFRDGGIVYENFSGMREISKALPVTKDSRFRAASLSKMFTMFGIMQLAEAGRIDLDEDVSSYLGFELRNPNFPDEKITVRMLASHTSTLRDGESYSLAPQYSIEEFFRPGGAGYEDGGHFGKEDKSYFKYCNLNYGVLGTIIERVSGERFDKYIKSNVLLPMGIKADYIVGNFEAGEFQNLGAIYRKEGGEWTAQADSYSQQPPEDTVWDKYSLNGYEIGTNATVFSPQGGLRISFEELGRCLEMLMNSGNFRGERIISEESFTEMCRPQWVYDENADNGDPYGVMFSYGLGLYQIDGSSKARLCEKYSIDFIGHSGEAYGLISGLYFRPGTQDGVIFMINGTGLEVDVDERSFGRFSSSYIWEEEIMNPICERIFAASQK